jgi:NADH-quinone oxidoreductase subunit J
MPITASQIVFLVIALATVLCGLMVVASRNLFHAALWLVGSFFGVAAVYATLASEFLAVAQVLIYIGAISTLIIFAIMLSRGMMMGRSVMRNYQWAISAVVAVLVFAVLVVFLLQINWPVVEQVMPADTIALIGQELVTTYLVPFEAIGVLLSVALIGAILVARER